MIRCGAFPKRSALISMAVPVEERPSVIERAFQIAKSGTVGTVAELSAQLTAEGYGNAEQLLAGRSLALQVTRMIAEASTPAAL
jgi:hypothetical protein